MHLVVQLIADRRQFLLFRPSKASVCRKAVKKLFGKTPETKEKNICPMFRQGGLVSAFRP